MVLQWLENNVYKYTYIYQKIAERSFPRVEYEPPVLPAFDDVRVLVQLSFLDLGHVLYADRVHGTNVWHQMDVARNASVYVVRERTWPHVPCRTRRTGNRNFHVWQHLEPIPTVTGDRHGTPRSVCVEIRHANSICATKCRDTTYGPHDGSTIVRGAREN